MLTYKYININTSLIHIHNIDIYKSTIMILLNIMDFKLLSSRWEIWFFSWITSTTIEFLADDEPKFI